MKHVSQKVVLTNRVVLADGRIVDGNKEHLTIAAVTKLPNGIALYSFEHKSPEYRLTERELELMHA